MAPTTLSRRIKAERHHAWGKFYKARAGLGDTF
jgi:hypothetical protein